jgi:hypothetical protein
MADDDGFHFVDVDMHQPEMIQNQIESSQTETLCVSDTQAMPHETIQNIDDQPECSTVQMKECDSTHHEWPDESKQSADFATGMAAESIEMSMNVPTVATMAPDLSFIAKIIRETEGKLPDAIICELIAKKYRNIRKVSAITYEMIAKYLRLVRLLPNNIDDCRLIVSICEMIRDERLQYDDSLILVRIIAHEFIDGDGDREHMDYFWAHEFIDSQAPDYVRIILFPETVKCCVLL